MPEDFIGCALGIVRRHHTSTERAPLAVVISIYYNTCFLELLQFKIPGGYSHLRVAIGHLWSCAGLLPPLWGVRWLSWAVCGRYRLYIHAYIRIYERQRLYMDVTGYQYPALL